MSSSQNLGNASPNRYSDIWVRPGCCGRKSDHYHWYKNGLSESPSCSFPASFFSPHDSQDIQRRGLPNLDACPVCRSHWENEINLEHADSMKNARELRELAAAPLGYAADELDAFRENVPNPQEESIWCEQAAREACGAWLVAVALCGSFLDDH